MLRSLVGLAVVGTLMLAPPAAYAEKHALVVGVNAYDNLGKDRQLEKAVNDAHAVGEALRELGFQVETVENVGRRGFNEAWSAFLDRLQPRDVVAFQFSGHGIEIDGANYLVLRDAPKTERSSKILMTSESISVDRLLRELHERHPQVSLLILDACRENPYEGEGWKAMGGTRGLARVDPPEGAFVMLSAGTRQSALDRLPGGDSDPNSVYTRKLLPLLTKPGLSLVDVAQEVRSAVRDLALSVQHEQTPAYYDQLTGRFYLAGEKRNDGGFAKMLDEKRSNETPPNEVAALREEVERLRVKMKQQDEMETGGGPRVGEAFRDCRGCPEMVVIPAGSFMMGSPAEEPERTAYEGPLHPVAIAKPFAVGKYMVTFAEWDACVADGGCGGYKPKDQGWGRGDHPVINVKWEDAQSYVKWLSRKTGKTYRLPSEAEWEYFARAGTTTPFWWGSSISPEQANYNGKLDLYKGGGFMGEYRRKTVSVKSFKPNPWGLYQVHGNVWEWTEDCWDDSYDNAPADGSARTRLKCSAHVLRGGSWSSDPWRLRAAVRFWRYYQNDFAGFRVARTL